MASEFSLVAISKVKDVVVTTVSDVNNENTLRVVNVKSHKLISADDDIIEITFPNNITGDYIGDIILNDLERTQLYIKQHLFPTAKAMCYIRDLNYTGYNRGSLNADGKIYFEVVSAKVVNGKIVVQLKMIRYFWQDGDVASGRNYEEFKAEDLFLANVGHDNPAIPNGASFCFYDGLTDLPMYNQFEGKIFKINPIAKVYDPSVVYPTGTVVYLPNVGEYNNTTMGYINGDTYDLAFFNKAQEDGVVEPSLLNTKHGVKQIDKKTSLFEEYGYNFNALGGLGATLALLNTDDYPKGVMNESTSPLKWLLSENKGGTGKWLLFDNTNDDKFLVLHRGYDINTGVGADIVNLSTIRNIPNRGDNIYNYNPNKLVVSYAKNIVFRFVNHSGQTWYVANFEDTHGRYYKYPYHQINPWLPSNIWDKFDNNDSYLIQTRGNNTALLTDDYYDSFCVITQNNTVNFKAKLTADSTCLVLDNVTLHGVDNMTSSFQITLKNNGVTFTYDVSLDSERLRLISFSVLAKTERTAISKLSLVVDLKASGLSLKTDDVIEVELKNTNTNHLVEVGNLGFGSEHKIECYSVDSYPSFKGFTTKEKHGYLTINPNQTALIQTNMILNFEKRKDCLLWFKKSIQENFIKNRVYIWSKDVSLHYLSHGGYMSGNKVTNKARGLSITLSEFNN